MTIISLHNLGVSRRWLFSVGSCFLKVMTLVQARAEVKSSWSFSSLSLTWLRIRDSFQLVCMHFLFSTTTSDSNWSLNPAAVIETSSSSSFCRTLITSCCPRSCSTFDKITRDCGFCDSAKKIGSVQNRFEHYHPRTSISRVEISECVLSCIRTAFLLTLKSRVMTEDTFIPPMSSAVIRKYRAPGSSKWKCVRLCWAPREKWQRMNQQSGKRSCRRHALSIMSDTSRLTYPTKNRWKSSTLRADAYRYDSVDCERPGIYPYIETIRGFENPVVAEDKRRRDLRYDKLRHDLLGNDSLYVCSSSDPLYRREHFDIRMHCMLGSTWRGHLDQNVSEYWECCTINVVTCHETRDDDTMQCGDLLCTRECK